MIFLNLYGSLNVTNKETNCNQRFFEGWIENFRYQNFILHLSSVPGFKKLTNRNKPCIDIFPAIHGKDFVCRLLDFGD